MSATDSILCLIGVNFINVKRVNFLYEPRFGSFFLVTCTYVEKRRSCVKFVRLTLMKLTTGVGKMWILFTCRKYDIRKYGHRKYSHWKYSHRKKVAAPIQQIKMREREEN